MISLDVQTSVLILYRGTIDVLPSQQFASLQCLWFRGLGVSFNLWFPVSCNLWFVVPVLHTIANMIMTDRPPACKTEKFVTINCEFSLPGLR